jgi:hypothetical protein
MLGRGANYDPPNSLSLLLCFHCLSARPKMSKGVLVFVAMISAANLALGRLGGKEVMGIGSVPSMNRRNKVPNSPCGPTAIGINALVDSMISPMTSSADKVRCVR